MCDRSKFAKRYTSIFIQTAHHTRPDILQAVSTKARQRDFREWCANPNLLCIATGRKFETIISIRLTH